MTDAVNRFYNSIENVADLSQAALVDLFVYFLTIEAGHESATAQQVNDCFTACDLAPPGYVAVYLSQGLSATPKRRYIRSNDGYRLERHRREALSKKLGAEQVTAQISVALRGLEHKVPGGEAREFLKETIDCFEAGANRATITMAWILALDHLQRCSQDPRHKSRGEELLRPPFRDHGEEYEGDLLCRGSRG